MIKILILQTPPVKKKLRKAAPTLSLVIISFLQPTAVHAATHDLALHPVMRGC